jgi:hypothetical protein
MSPESAYGAPSGPCAQFRTAGFAPPDCGWGYGPGRGPPLFCHGLKDMQDMHRFKLERCIRLPGPIRGPARSEAVRTPRVPRISVPLTIQHVADCLHGQRLHSSECGLTTDHNGEARVSPSHGS